MPRERIAKHLSERAPTAGSIHVNIHKHLIVDGSKTSYNTPNVFILRFVPGKRFKLPQIVKLYHFVPEKRFRQNQIMAVEIKKITKKYE